MSKKVYICDIETNGLLDTITKIHCLSLGWTNKEEEFKISTTFDYNYMKKIVTDPEVTLVGHNFFLFDIIALERILGVKAKCKIIDTLGLAWYLDPRRTVYSLESYAIDYSMNKVEIEQWDGEGPEFQQLMKERCEHDVRIQNILYNKQIKHLLELYNDDLGEVDRLVEYISFKLDCIKEQQSTGVNFDSKLAQNSLNKLLEEKSIKIDILEKGMPKQPIKAVKKVPAKPYKADGELSATGLKWFAFLKEHGYPLSHMKDIEYIKDYEEPNPGSHVQVKNWLFDLGWEPENYKFTRNKKTGEIKQVPQIKSKEEDGTLCPSILKLLSKAPALEALNGLSIINHRISVFEGMLRDQVDGRLYQNIGGLTPTFRFTHRTIVNLPKASMPWGEEIRGSLITDNENTVLCGTDLSNIESMTKCHYMFPYDPDYVNTIINDKDFDSHTDIAFLAGMMTQDDLDFFIKIKKKKKSKEFISEEELSRFSKLEEIRSDAKPVNFGALYLIGAKTLSRNTGKSIKECEKILKVFWERNKAILDFTKDCITKVVRDQLWVFNPISKFWISMRNEKDVFSCVNQSSAVYVQDLYIKYTRKAGIKIAFQVHDEMTFNLPKGKEEQCTQLLKQAIQQVNDELKLDVQISSSIDYGDKYSTVH